MMNKKIIQYIISIVSVALFVGLFIWIFMSLVLPVLLPQLIGVLNKTNKDSEVSVEQTIKNEAAPRSEDDTELSSTQSTDNDNADDGLAQDQESFTDEDGQNSRPVASDSSTPTPIQAPNNDQNFDRGSHSEFKEAFTI